MTKPHYNSKHLEKIQIEAKESIANAVESFKANMDYPDMSKYTSEALSLMKIQTAAAKSIANAMESFKVNIDYPDMSNYIKATMAMDKVKMVYLGNIMDAMNALNKIDYPDLSNLTKVATVIKDSKLSNIAYFNNVLNRIDWKRLKLTDDEIKVYNEKLEEVEAEELDENKAFKNVTEKLKITFIVIYYLIDIINSLINITNFVENTVIPVNRSYHEQEGSFQSEQAAVKWINDELKKEAENQITKNFRIVTKDDLVVRNSKRIDSRMNGKLKVGNVVQIVEKRRNFTYVFYSDYEANEVIEGWVFTRYLKQIK